jgi:hypothetical protein
VPDYLSIILLLAAYKVSQSEKYEMIICRDRCFRDIRKYVTAAEINIYIYIYMIV